MKNKYKVVVIGLGVVGSASLWISKFARRFYVSACSGHGFKFATGL